MKKVALFTVSVLIILFATSCNKDTTNEHAGKYSGAFSTIVGDSVINTNGEISFSSGVTKEKNLYLYGVQLTKESDFKYISDARALNTILASVSGESTELTLDLNATFLFSGNIVDMDLRHGSTTILTFSGTKQ